MWGLGPLVKVWGSDPVKLLLEMNHHLMPTKSLGYGGFPKFGGTILGGPYSKGRSILAAILGAPYVGKLPHGPLWSAALRRYAQELPNYGHGKDCANAAIVVMKFFLYLQKQFVKTISSDAITGLPSRPK